jgi:Tol biopolymer transport system component/DNA-binding winged helix-turn-helix (wHTH) protein
MRTPMEKAKVRYGVFELDRVNRRLFRNARWVKLQDQPLRLLELLVDRAGTVVTRDAIRDALWPSGTFVEFDASVANALRKIRLALGDDAANSRFVETVPRQGYRFIAPVSFVLPAPGPEASVREPHLAAAPAPVADVREQQAPPAAALSVAIRASSQRRYPWRRWAVAASLGGLIVAGIFLWRAGRPGSGDGAIMTVLTSFPGPQTFPALSPDGSQVAFIWRGEEPGSQGVYIAMSSGGGAYRRITNSAANDAVPVWSPDASRIAFVRDRAELMLISPLGGNERRVASALPYFISWSPDGKEIAYAAMDGTGPRFAVFATNVETGVRRQITYPPLGATGDSHADFSPDGKRLAFVRCYLGNCDVYISSSGGGAPRRVTADHSSFRGLTWSPDGRSIVYSSRRRGPYRLWQVDASSDGATPIEVASAGEDANFPRYAAGGHGRWRLVYEKRIFDSNIWEVQLGPAGKQGRRDISVPPRRLIASTRTDSSPQLSPDGRTVVLVSDRTGYDELWTANADGGNQAELTFLRAQGVGSPRWSPDGNRIVFDVLTGAGRAVFIVDVHGGTPAQWTEWNDASRPSWSRDGLWIYYAQSDTAARKQIWKISAGAGRKPQQITTDGGIEPRESPDGKTLFYMGGTNLRSVPVAGGAWSSVLARPIADGWWELAGGGVYFADLFGGGPGPRVLSGPKPIFFLDPRSGAMTKIADVTGDVNRATPDFCVTADGRSILYSIVEVSTSEVHMIEGMSPKY